MDHYILTGPNGSRVDLGSWLMADPGPDFGAKDLIRAEYAESPLSEGGLLTAEHVGVRRFSFPLRPRSCAGIAGGLPGVEAFIASLARPGAYVDLMPEGTATADAVRFDVLGGRYEESYSVALQRIGRREGELKLEVEPYGYWPTEMILASTASIGLPGALAINGASILGDVPARARIAIQPTITNTIFTGSLATYIPDFIAWTMGDRASAFFGASSFVRWFGYGGTIIGAAKGVGSTVHNVYPLVRDTWQRIGYVRINDSALHGPMNAIAFLGAVGATTVKAEMKIALDAVTWRGQNYSLASARLPVSLYSPGHPSHVYSGDSLDLVDLGRLCLPPAASGVAQVNLVRLWVKPGPSYTATSALSFGGLALMRQDAPMGLLSDGVIPYPSDRLVLDSLGGDRIYLMDDDEVRGIPRHYRGGLPELAPSQIFLSLIGAARQVQAPSTSHLAYPGTMHAAVSITYRPRFRFLKSF